MRILVTGGARQIGAGLVNHFCRQGPRWLFTQPITCNGPQTPENR